LVGEAFWQGGGGKDGGQGQGEEGEEAHGGLWHWGATVFQSDFVYSLWFSVTYSRQNLSVQPSKLNFRPPRHAHDPRLRLPCHPP
jgi:hypothetical protein